MAAAYCTYCSIRVYITSYYCMTASCARYDTNANRSEITLRVNLAKMMTNHKTKKAIDISHDDEPPPSPTTDTPSISTPK